MTTPAHTVEYTCPFFGQRIGQAPQYQCLYPPTPECNTPVTVDDVKYCSSPVTQCNSRTSPSQVFVGTFYLTPAESLYHGSPALFNPPYLPYNYENRFSPKTNFPMYYATKGKDPHTGEAKEFGFMYEYKIRPEMFTQHGGIPNVVFMCGRVFDAIGLYRQEILGGSDIKTLTAKIPNQARANYGNDDLEMAASCLGYNGLFFPGHEYQILLCRRTVASFLQLHKIYRVRKNPKGGYITEELMVTPSS